MLWQDVDLLSHQQGQEGPQSRGLHVVPAYPLHPEVRSLPGNLVAPKKKMKVKPSLSILLDLHSLKLFKNTLIEGNVAYRFSFGSSLSFKSWNTNISLWYKMQKNHMSPNCLCTIEKDFSKKTNSKQ